MAVKKNAAKQPEVKGMSDTKRWIYGFALLFFALFLAVSVLSFFFFWKDDQSVTDWTHVFMSSKETVNEARVQNWGGKLGAVLAKTVVADGFGLFGLCIPAVLIIFSLRIMRFRPAMLRKSVRLTLILMILGSLTLGFLFRGNWEVFGTGLGGRHGISIAEWLVSVIGTIGTGLLLLLSIVLYAIYINRNTISMINRVGKGIVDNGRKVGEAVSTTAAGILSHEAKQTDDAKPETKSKKGKKEIDDDDPFIVRSADDDPPLYPGELIDDNGFTIVDRSGAPALPEEEPRPARTGKVEVDDAGFVITDMNAKTAPPPPEKDEDGFVIQYASGDEAEETPAPATGKTDIGTDTYTYPEPPVSATETACPPAQETQQFQSAPAYTAETPETSGAEAKDDAFVAAVPDGLDIEERRDLTVERLPGDESLSDEEIESALYDPTLDLSSYQRPPIELLEDHSVEVSVTSEEIVENKNRIKETLENFGIKIDKIKATVGPTVTLYEIVQAPGVRISKIKNLEDDIAQSLAALGIRIIAPIPGKGTIGIEVPNKDKKIVSMYSIIKSVKFQESDYDIPVVLGKTIQDETFVIDLAKMPHLLVAGATTGEVTVRNLNPVSLQADMAIVDALTRAGAQITTTTDSVTVRRSPLHAFEFDATHCPDLFPALAALAAAADGVSTIRGTSRLLHKESNRAEAIREEYAKVGIEVDISEEDVMRIRGGKIRPARVSSHDDHRMAMSMAVSALRCDGQITIENAECVAKSYPGFFEDLEKIRV